MDGAKLREVMTTALPRDEVKALARALGVVERNSVIVLEELVNALVLSARTPGGGRQADVLRLYLKNVEQKPVRGTFYERFNGGLEKLLFELLRRTVAAAASDPVLLPAAISGVTDWLAIDSETVRLHPTLKDIYPSTGDGAAVKIHKAFSLGRHNTLQYLLTPARDHDSKHFLVGEECRGYGFLMDLAYASHARLTDMIRHEAFFVVRLKNGWKAAIDAVHAGDVDELVAGTDIADAMSLGQLACADGVLDADVTLASGTKRYSLRLVAVDTKGKGLCVFLTNLSRDRYAPATIGDLYRLRWEIEKNNKVDKSDFCLDQLDCRKTCSARTMIYASLLGSVIANRLVHADHVARAAAHAPATHGPIHVRLLAMALAAFYVPISNALAREKPDSTEWNTLAGKLAHLSRDPNWRSRPSVLDTLHGFVASRGRPRRQTAIGSLARGDR
jgi:hypothetical protein